MEEKSDVGWLQAMAVKMFFYLKKIIDILIPFFFFGIFNS
jgi:hypothetical protein